jgi:hypothetical protein
MKKIVFVLVAVLCINNLAWSQEEKVEATQELRYFKEDNAFYSGGMRLLDSELEKKLSSNLSALEAWKKGNAFKKANNGLKIATGVLLGSSALALSLPWAIVFLRDWDANVFWCLALSAIFVSTGLVTGIMIPITKAKYKSCYSEAVGIYNKGFSTTAVSLKIGTTDNGIGFSLNF